MSEAVAWAGLPPVLHVDAHVVAVDKPSGLLSVPGRGEANADCVSARVQAVYADAHIVHRLDMGTSGVMVLGRGAQAQRALSRSFERRDTDKTYEALVSGCVAEEAGEIDLPLICDWPNRPRQKVDFVVGKPSLTRWEVLARDPVRGTTRLRLRPVTGRSHQLRVHLQALGHPILGDDLYAPPAVVAQAPRLLLHATWLSLPHPHSAERLTLHAPVPF
jgi:tRNA pseudouridine32 synthase/23S rRNA pseudouridine746 synthase